MARLGARARRALLVTCEHASWRLPPAYGSLGLARSVARSHIAWDEGAAAVARRCSQQLGCSYVEARYSRLLVDLNRSESNPKIVPRLAFGTPVPANARADARERARRIERYWRPHRADVLAAVTRAIDETGRCLHFAIHSFRPALARGRDRCDVGLLYDPGRRLESRAAQNLKNLLAAEGLSVYRNYPYRGITDGLTRALRRTFAARSYVGLEVELSQRLIAEPSARRRWAFALSDAFASLGTGFVRDIGRASRRRPV